MALMPTLMLDMLAAIARKDYEDRRRQKQERARAAGTYKGRPEDTRRNASITSMLKVGLSYSQIQDATGCSRATVAKIAARLLALHEGDRARSSIAIGCSAYEILTLPRRPLKLCGVLCSFRLAMLQRRLVNPTSPVSMPLKSRLKQRLAWCVPQQDGEQ